jgi:hypothetical protein
VIVACLFRAGGRRRRGGRGFLNIRFIVRELWSYRPASEILSSNTKIKWLHYVRFELEIEKRKAV